MTNDSSNSSNGGGNSEFLITGSQAAPRTLVLAHGAGAPMDSDFMNVFAAGLAAAGWRVVRFEFPYMVERRRRGVKRPPDREPVLRATWLKAIESLDAHSLVLGGKSMGGRIASLIADDVGAAGLACLGYPFHPTGQPDRVRIEHLKTIRTPTLIVQGERDPFGNRSEVASYALSPNVHFHWLPDGDHSFVPRKSSGKTAEENWREGIRAIDDFFGPP